MSYNELVDTETTQIGNQDRLLERQTTHVVITRILKNSI